MQDRTESIGKPNTPGGAAEQAQGAGGQAPSRASVGLSWA